MEVLKYCIFERLDRVFGNNIFMNLALESEVHHLIRQESYHTPLHVSVTLIREQSTCLSSLEFKKVL